MNSFYRFGEFRLGTTKHENNKKQSSNQSGRNNLGRKLKPYSLIASALLLSFSASNFANETNEIERLEVVGQINTGLMESEIALANTSAPDLRSQLSQLPGVSVNGNGLLSGIIQYRGLFGDRLKVKIDGVEIAGAGPNAMDSPLSHALGNRQDLVLYQGIAPVSVGYETLAGAIVIKDASPTFSDTNEWQTASSLSGSWFSNNEAKMLGINVASANAQSYVSFQGQYQDADNYESGNGQEVPSTFYERSGLKFSAGKHTDDYEIDFLIGSRNTNESGTPALAMDITFVDSLWYKLAVAKNISADWKAKVKVFGNQNEHIMRNFDLRPAPDLSAYRENEVDSEAIGGDLDLIQDAGANNWRFGASYYSQSNNSRITNPNNAAFFIQNFNNIQREVTSLYAEYDIAAITDDDIHWQIGSRFSNIGYDADDVGSNMVMMNPNVASLVSEFNQADRDLSFALLDIVIKAEAKINESLQATLSLGQKERAPVYSELYTWFPLGVSAGLADGRNYLGNLDLKKESAAQIDLGLQLQHDGLTIMGNLFYQNIDNYIIGVPSSNMPANMISAMMGAQQPLQWNNRSAKLKGADLYLSKIIGSHWQATASAQWVQGELTEAIDGERYPLYRIAPVSGNIALHWNKNDLNLSLVLNVAAAQDEVSSLQNETETAGYGVWNLNARYQVSSALSLSLVAENLLDKEYAQHLGGVNRVSGSEIAIGQKVPEIGRNIGLYAEYTF
jgi:iron complex outermembrane receptor protein